MDEDLSFIPHAKQKLKQCNQSWGLIKRNTSRVHGLNTRSLTYLFRTVVLTKLLYGGVVWLSNNLSIFDSLWNDVMLKCSGSMFYPHRELTELMLQLPPLDVQLEILTIKFLCKCLNSKDMMSSSFKLLNHYYYNHLLRL